MGDFPIMTEKGTFIVNGTERVVVSQLVRSPGVIFEPGERFRLRNLTKHQLVKGTIHPYRGEWMEFDVEQKPGKDVTAGTRVARKRRLGIFTLLRALGYDEEAPRLPRPLRRPLRLPPGPVGQGARRRPDPGRGPRRDLQAGPPRRAADGRVGQGLLPQRLLREPPLRPRRVGRYKLNRKLGSEVAGSASCSACPTSSSTSPRTRTSSAAARSSPRHLHAPPRQAGARLPARRPGPLRQPAHPLGRRADPEPGPHRPVAHGARRPRAHDHPGRRGDHAADADQHPPGRRRDQGVLRDVPAVAVHGPGEPLSGSPTAAACRRSVRAACPASAPASRSATSTSATTAGCARSRRRRARTSASSAACRRSPGSTSSASSRARTARSNGKVTGEIVYMAADEEENYVVAQANTPINPTARSSTSVLVRRSPQAASLDDLRKMLEAESFGATTDIGYVPPSEVDFMDVSPKQIVSVGTALIPFLEHDDANRPDGRQHAEAGRAAGARRGAVHRHRHRGPCRPRRRRPAPGARGR